MKFTRSALVVGAAAAAGLIVDGMMVEGKGAAQTRPQPLAGTVGGPGGTFFSTRCPDNQVLVGVAGRSGTVIDQVAPVCVALDVESRWIGEPIVGRAEGGKGGGPFITVCPRDTAATGFTSFAREFVFNIRLRCEFPGRRGESVPPPPPVGGSLEIGSSAGAQCPGSQLASGIRGTASHFINRFGISCNVSNLDLPVKTEQAASNVRGKVFTPARSAVPRPKTSIFAIVEQNGDMLFSTFAGMRDGAPSWERRLVPFGNGWRFRHVFSMGDGVIIAITMDGRVLYYKCQCLDGEPSWVVQAQTIAEGWPEYMRVFADRGGVIFALDWSNRLYYYRFLGVGDGSPAWGGQRVLIDQDFRATHAFSGIDGETIFAVTPDGEMLYYRYDGMNTGRAYWTIRGKRINAGWSFRHVFSPGDGVILAVDYDGQMFWYRYTGQNGETAWDPRSRRLIETNTTRMQHVFAY